MREMKNAKTFIGKTKKEILDMMIDDQFNDIHSNEWTFLSKKDFWGNKNYLHIIFEDNIVIRTKVIIKYFWQKT